jgi:hydroxymethylpyrimidine/phosphomethylpyrimidine kinase
VQADLRTFAALGVFGTCAITSVTAQNTREVRAVEAMPVSLVRLQVETVLDDLAVAGAKCGLLATREIVREVAELAPRLPPLVVDPVLVASSGALLAGQETVNAYLEYLFPLAAIVTPNLHEASAMLGEPVTTLDEARAAARRLGGLTPVVVVKGGHLIGGESVDVVWDGRDCWEIRQPRVVTANTHGSGCTFSAAIAANLARGLPAREAIEQANSFVYRAIVGGATWHLGGGYGPLDHFGWEQGGRG